MMITMMDDERERERERKSETSVGLRVRDYER